MAGTEVSKEVPKEVSKEVTKVVGIEEKYQDLPKPECNGTNHHSQANDIDNSYVFVTGADGLPDDAVENKDVGAEGLRVLPESGAAAVEDQGAKPESQGEKLDAVSGGCSESVNEEDNENAERSIGDPAVVADRADAVHDSVAEQTGESESLAEAEVKQVEDPDGKVESSAEAVLEEVEDKNVKLQGVVEGEQEKLDDLIKSESLPRSVENQESQVGALGLVAVSGENGELSNISSNIANCECGDRVELTAVETSKACEGSPNLFVDVVECKLQDASVEADQDVVKLEPYPNNDKEVTPKEETMKNLSSDVLENQQCDTVLGKNVQGVLELIDEAKPVVSSTDCHLETVLVEKDMEDITISHVDNGIPCPEEPDEHPDGSEVTTNLSSDVLENQQCDTVLGKNVQDVLEPIDEAKPVVSSTDCHVEKVLVEKDMEDFSVSHVENGIPCPEEPEKHPDDSEVSREIMQSETKSEASMPTQSFPASNAHVPPTEVEISDAETVEAVSSAPVDGPKSQVIENKASLGSGSTLDAVVPTETEPNFQGGEAHAETEVSNGEAKVANSPPATLDVKLELEVHDHNISAISIGEKTDDVTVACRTEVLDSSNVNKEGTANTVLEIKGVEGTGDQLDGAANEDTGNSHSNNLSVASTEDSSENMIDGEEARIKTKPKPFNFLIRIPRFDDDSLREQIRLAKLHVDEKTKLRDAIQVQIQEIRANNQIHGIDYEYAKGEARSARKLVRSKRMEIDSLQSVINKAKNALSIEDIDSQIYNMEHMIQHETLPLKEEKQLIREIKQLKQLREQLSSNMGSQDEIKQALEQREEVEERLKILRKELDVLKDKVLKAEAAAMEAEKRYDDQNKKVKELQAQFRAADDVRQAAYAQWQSLRKELSKKSKHFFKYKDDAAIASNYAFRRDTEALYRLCTNQVENFMELWNKNDEFRRDYVKFNTRSTVRRFGTLDSRSLGPDEKPPILPSNADEGVNRMVSTPAKVDSISRLPNLEPKRETTVENATNVTSDGKIMKKVTEHKNHKVTNEGPATMPVQVNGLDNVVISGKDATNEVHDEPKKSREEIESVRKAEEMRREEAEAKLKEQRRLEALAKAHEARERKKRQAEKLQMRAELKTQKEAEQREKEREKRLRKKERKKAAAATDVNDINNNSETAPSSESATEIGKDIEVKDTSPAALKKPQKPWLFTKQSKTKSVPPPLRNRNKKKLQQWMWVGITSLIILVLFWLGNIGVFPTVNLKRRSPVY